MNKYLAMALTVALSTVSVASADYIWELTEQKSCSIGADIRTRLYHMDENVQSPGSNADLDREGFLRTRQRVWGCYSFNEDTHLRLRLVNQVRYYWTDGGDPNNLEGGNKYRFPDEVIFDKFVLELNNIMDSNWSLAIGRQDIILGNGMVVLEGTAADAGRTIYFDGVVATYETEKNNLKLLVTHSNYKDKAAFINDQNRPLTASTIDLDQNGIADRDIDQDGINDGAFLPDVTMAGAYWTHNLRDALNFDLYYLYMDVDDEKAIGTRIALDNVGVRLFGDLSPMVSYSAEYAKQFGDGDFRRITSGRNSDMSGEMVDLRLYLKTGKETTRNPLLLLQYTMFSGDDYDPTVGTGDEYEGWVNVFARYPIWREDITAYVLNQLGFNNFEQLRATLTMDVTPKVKGTFAYAMMRKLENTTAGDELGQLAHAALDYTVNENLVISLDAAYFFAGDAYATGNDGEWIMLQGSYTF